MTLIILAGVAGTALSLYGLWRLLRDHRFLGVTAVALYVFLVATVGRPYYLGGLYRLLAAAGAVGLQRCREAGARRWRWAVWPAFVLSAAVAAASLAVGSAATTESGPIGSGITQRAASAYHPMPAEQQRCAAIMGQSYIIAAYIDGYSEQYDIPAATHAGLDPVPRHRGRRVAAPARAADGRATARRSRTTLS